jgi:hypothetical protein
MDRVVEIWFKSTFGTWIGGLMTIHAYSIVLFAPSLSRWGYVL